MIDKLMNILGYVPKKKVVLYEDLVVALDRSNSRTPVKRLDEFRELCEWLNANCHKEMKRDFWVIGWLQLQDAGLEDVFKLRYGHLSQSEIAALRERIREKPSFLSNNPKQSTVNSGN
ncbi:hypothetical protein [Vibrio sp. SCSIO 43155]|uniref:hypothetical protein n=1 Tax=Vibrio sp. SCSIO 43155 TaxID=2819099 RepID=UPI002075930C|nr:hypothetical protein [Vibrio sp. SCSIO 43155]USD58635.1 hypothetical protein J4N44_27160 [Vibrio sp. SCSIO 43155]